MNSSYRDSLTLARRFVVEQGGEIAPLPVYEEELNPDVQQDEASTVDREVIENSSTYLFGRTESNELRHPNYSTFSDEVKTKLTTLPQGQLLARFAKFSQPIFLKFPFPPCLSGDQYRPDGGPEEHALL
jgi:hypothetical protein